MIYNKLQNLTSENDLKALDYNFHAFSSEIKSVKSLQTSLKDFYPYGADFDKVKKDISVESGEIIIKNTPYYYFSENYFSDTVLKMHYHEGLRYQGNNSITFYETQINPGTVIYLEDPSYFTDANYSTLKIGRAFLYMTMPYVWGYDLSIGSNDSNYILTFSKDFKKLSGRIIGATGITNWQSYYNDEAKPIEFFGEQKDAINIKHYIYFDNKEKILYVNKLFIKTRKLKNSDINYITSPLDRKYQIKFFFKVDSDGNPDENGKTYVPLELDYGLITDGRENDTIYDSYADYLKIDLSQYVNSLDWLFRYGAIIIY